MWNCWVQRWNQTCLCLCYNCTSVSNVNVGSFRMDSVLPTASRGVTPWENIVFSVIIPARRALMRVLIIAPAVEQVLTLTKIDLMELCFSFLPQWWNLKIVYYCCQSASMGLFSLLWPPLGKGLVIEPEYIGWGSGACWSCSTTSTLYIYEQEAGMNSIYYAKAADTKPNVIIYVTAILESKNISCKWNDSPIIILQEVRKFPNEFQLQPLKKILSYEVSLILQPRVSSIGNGIPWGIAEALMW